MLKYLFFKIRNYIEKLLDCKSFDFIALSLIVFLVIVQIILHSFTKEDSSIKKESYENIKVELSEDFNFFLNVNHQINYKIKKNDTLIEILSNIGISDNDIFNILRAMKEKINPKSLIAGQELILRYHINRNYKDIISNKKEVEEWSILDELVIKIDAETQISILRQDDKNYISYEVKKELTKKIVKYDFTINDSLFVDGQKSGVSANIMVNLINLYSFDIDFQRDIRSGDKVELLLEAFYDNDDKFVKDGKILFSSLNVRKNPIDIYLFNNGKFDQYFNKDGRTIKKSLLKTPINGARLSSGFGMRRHPILGYNKMHQGLDFAAPTGTPIFAAGSGTITYRGRRGAYGNFILIKHNNGYETAYAHLSRYSSKFRNGSRVKQGDVIGYVGSTGRSTGPHLHYEVRKSGRRIDPRKMKMIVSKKLPKKELKKFFNNRDYIDSLREITMKQNLF
jgi:murein DD-endopeptidase MepM/ murein hydrolase activator NlpD